jgi:mannose-6-phosphate isomerase-like protein (cupin superfamily)
MSDEAIVLGPGEGRAYVIDAMRGVFKADHEDYTASEWSVEPGAGGPGPHSHPEQTELFLVTEGTMSFLVGDDWVDAPAGSFLRVPPGVTHDFANRTTEAARAYNVFVPGRHFERQFAGWAQAATPER